MKPVVNERKCPAQEKICPAIPACPEKAITYVADNTRPLGGRIVFDYDRCNGCGTCLTNCCGNAIEIG